MSGLALGSAGMVASHDLLAPARSVTVTATVRVNYARVLRSGGYVPVLEEGVNGRASLRLEVTHPDVPDCSGSHSVVILDYWEGVSSHPAETLNLSAVLECGELVQESRLMLDVSAHAQAHLESGITGYLGTTGSIHTEVDLDVVKMELQAG